MTHLTVTILLVVGAMNWSHGGSRAPSPEWLWWEAETPKSTNFPQSNPLEPADAKAAQVLSGGRWISASHPGKPLFLEYEVAVRKASTYRFYARKFWSHGPFRWRFDDQPWRDCGRDIGLLDEVKLSQFVSANWVDLGVVALDSGKHTLRIELAEDTEAAAFDCFLLTRGPFAARGKLKPGERFEAAPAGWFVFDPEADAFGTAAMDLRFLNERLSGEGGFIQVSGDAFVHEKTGRAVRFWGVNSGPELLDHDPADLDRFARRLAKMGVNIVRLQGSLWREDDLTRVDEAKITKIHHLVAALKKQGIYLALSTYFPSWFHPRGLPGFEGFTGDMMAFAVPFFNERFQALQRTWWKTALTRINPETGLSLVQDPTLAFIEIMNEDGLLFWTFSPYDKVPGPQMEILERRFGQWLSKTYGGIEQSFARWRGGKMFTAWTGGKIKGDIAAEGRVGFISLWQMANERNLRAQDTAAFLAELQRDYFDRMYGYLKKDLGFKGSITGSNWITADPRILGPLDKWSNAGCDFMDRHGYYAGPHEGERAGYLVSPGDRYNDASALRFETGKGKDRSFDLPLMDLAYNGKPSTISEINWLPPNRFRADMPVLAAAYGALQGSDGFFFFLTSDVDGARRLTKFSIGDPVAMGQFPAAALIFRRSLVKTADAVVRVEAKLSDLFALRGIPIAASENLDEFRKKDVPLGTPPTPARPGKLIDPLAFLTGRVEVNVTATGGVSKISDLAPLIDRERKTVHSATKELFWDYGHGLATVDAPAAQGVTGFLAKGGAISLGDVTIESAMEYGSILIVSMDDRPLKTSRRMLLQVMSEDNNSGWSAPGDGMRPIIEVGNPPLVVKRLAGRVSVKRVDAPSLKVSALDFNGYETGAVLVPSRTGELTLLPSTIYYLIRK